ncbi:MAG TPA: hypothetical protein VEY67_02655 [Candidatus Dormibacteraeota bacterium]|nr:hypothetical protein [Candidatus Dormibacteraeota bacterium]
MVRRLMLIAIGSVVLALSIAPVASADGPAKRACDPVEQVPAWQSLAYAPVPRGLTEGTHTLTFAFRFTDVDGTIVDDTIDGIFDVSRDVPVVGGMVWVTPWAMLAPTPPRSRAPIWVMNPAQPAMFVLGWGTPREIPEIPLTVTRQLETKLFHAMSQTVSLDGGPAIPMHFHQVAESCFWVG